jgi:hypothetical protein
MKRLLVRIRQLGTKIVRILSENEVLLLIVSIILMFLTITSACLIVMSIFYSFTLFLLAIILLIFVWAGWALIGIIQDEEDFYF